MMGWATLQATRGVRVLSQHSAQPPLPPRGVGVGVIAILLMFPMSFCHSWDTVELEHWEISDFRTKKQTKRRKNKNKKNSSEERHNKARKVPDRKKGPEKPCANGQRGNAGSVDTECQNPKPKPKPKPKPNANAKNQIPSSNHSVLSGVSTNFVQFPFGTKVLFFPRVIILTRIEF